MKPDRGSKSMNSRNFIPIVFFFFDKSMNSGIKRNYVLFRNQGRFQKPKIAIRCDRLKNPVVTSVSVQEQGCSTTMSVVRSA